MYEFYILDLKAVNTSNKTLRLLFSISFIFSRTPIEEELMILKRVERDGGFHGHGGGHSNSRRRSGR